jgi:hypothetical protein
LAYAYFFTLLKSYAVFYMCITVKRRRTFCHSMAISYFTLRATVHTRFHITVFAFSHIFGKLYASFLFYWITESCIYSVITNWDSIMNPIAVLLHAGIP